MTSGVKVADGVKDIFKEMKVVNAGTNVKERIRLLVFKICGSYIDVEDGKIYRQEDMEKVDDIFKFFLDLLDPKQCRYILYDCHFQTTEASQKEELVFVMWAPESASIKEKMNYASSKEALRKSMTGIKHELQMNDLSDYGDRDSFAEKIGNGVIVTTVEGHPVRSATTKR